MRFEKRHFIKEKQITRHFVQYMECLSNLPSLYAISIQGSQPIMKSLGKKQELITTIKQRRLRAIIL